MRARNVLEGFSSLRKKKSSLVSHALSFPFLSLSLFVLSLSLQKECVGTRDQVVFSDYVRSVTFERDRRNSLVYTRKVLPSNVTHDSND